MNDTLGRADTLNVVVEFLTDCYKFWLEVGKTEEEAIECTLKDADGLTLDPFSPEIRQLDDEAVKITVDVWSQAMRALICK